MSLTFCAAVMQIVLLAAADSDAGVKQAPPAKAEAAKKTETAANAENAKEGETSESYGDAHRVTAKTGKPLVVMVGADWCGPCQNMRRTILPRVREHGLFRKVAFAHVNVDRERELATELTGGGAVPQLIMFRKTKDGWSRQKMVGAHSVDDVEKFINDGLAKNDSEQPAEDSVIHSTSTTHSTGCPGVPDDEKQEG